MLGVVEVGTHMSWREEKKIHTHMCPSSSYLHPFSPPLCVLYIHTFVFSSMWTLWYSPRRSWELGAPGLPAWYVTPKLFFFFPLLFYSVVVFVVQLLFLVPVFAPHSCPSSNQLPDVSACPCLFPSLPSTDGLQPGPTPRRGPPAGTS